MLVELINDSWISIDSLANPQISEFIVSGDSDDIGSIIGVLPYDRYYNCYQFQYEHEDQCIEEFLGYDEITEQTTIDFNLIVADGNNLISFQVNSLIIFLQDFITFPKYF